MRLFYLSCPYAVFLALLWLPCAFAAPQDDKLMQLAAKQLLPPSTSNTNTQTKPNIKPSKQPTKAATYKQPQTYIPTAQCARWSAACISQKAQPHKKTIEQYAKSYNVHAALIKAIITAESCFKVRALSPKGAQGLMQLIPATARRFGVTDSHNAAQNIRGGVRYLQYLLNHFGGDLEKVIATYNAGEGAVDKYRGIPPFKETRAYVKNVLHLYAKLYPHINPNKPGIGGYYQPATATNKAGRQGWRYNKRIAPHLFKDALKSPD